MIPILLRGFAFALEGDDGRLGETAESQWVPHRWTLLWERTRDQLNSIKRSRVRIGFWQHGTDWVDFNGQVSDAKTVGYELFNVPALK